MSKSTEQQVKDTARRDNFDRSVSGSTDSWDKMLDAYAYKLFGDFFADRREQFDGLQETLDEAHYGVSVDLYLARATLYALILGIVGVIVGSLVATGLHVAGILPSIQTGITFPHQTIPMDAFVRAYKFPLQVLAISLTLLISFGLTAAGGAFIWPKIKASGRRRSIDRTLPYAVTFMYALSRGGMNFIEVLETLADSEEVYGEISEEVKPIVKDLDYFSRDLPRALHDAGRRTPSQKFESFTDDLVGVLDTGADLTNFLEDKSEQYLEEAEREQKNFIEFLELLGEVYVTAFVAGPLFLLIITVVMAMLGGTSIVQLYGIVYLLLPIMNVLFFLFIDTISGGEGDLSSTLPQEGQARDTEELQELIDQTGGDERLERMLEAKKRRERNEFFRDPIGVTLREPWHTLVFTVPLALLVMVFMLTSGIVTPTMEGMMETPIETTFFLGILPILITIVPYSAFYEVNAWREGKLMGRLPDALKQLASNNAVGMTLPEALDAAAENTGGRLGEEFKKVRNDIEWKHDINGALVAFANRVKSPILARTVKLITEANQSTGDIEDVLDVAAKDVMTRQRLKKEQKSALRMYTAVILISFAVYLFVIAVLDAAFLSQLAELGQAGGEEAAEGAAQQAQQAQQGGGGGQGFGGMDMSDLPVDKFRMVFYHSTVVQALSSGMLAGTLGSGDPRAGLKYSSVLIVVATGVFWLL